MRAILNAGACFAFAIGIVGCSGTSSADIPVSQEVPQNAAIAPAAAPLYTSSVHAVAIGINGSPISVHAVAIGCQATPVQQVLQPDKASCGAMRRTDVAPNPAASPAALAGLRPVDLQNGYDVATAAASAGAGQTVAVVVAYANARLESDLATYRAEFGLSPCTVGNGCLPESASSANTSNCMRFGKRHARTTSASTEQAIPIGSPATKSSFRSAS